MLRGRGYDDKSCGAVLYTVRSGVLLIYLVRNRGGHIGFPKGHVESGENERRTALREIREETGRTAVLDPRFRAAVRYELPDGRIKKTVFFLARFEDDLPASPSAEIREAWLAEVGEARRLVTYPQERDVLDRAATLLLSDTAPAGIAGGSVGEISIPRRDRRGS